MKESYGQLCQKLIKLTELRILELEAEVESKQMLLAEYRQRLTEAKEDFELWRLHFDTPSN